jgi:hypothetical protein
MIGAAPDAKAAYGRSSRRVKSTPETWFRSLPSRWVAQFLRLPPAPASSPYARAQLLNQALASPGLAAIG